MADVRKRQIALHEKLLPVSSARVRKNALARKKSFEQRKFFDKGASSKGLLATLTTHTKSPFRPLRQKYKLLVQ